MSPARGADAAPLLIILSGPSGVGKDALLSRMRERGASHHLTVTATTRPRRPGERDGVDYIFLTRERFEGMIERGELLEWAEVHGNLYGVPRAQVAGALDDGRDVIIKPDVQGAATIRSLVPDAVSIFLAPPSDDELRRRLEERLTETPEVLKRRLKTAKVEMGEASKFDHVVINHNGRLDQAVDDVDEIVARERRRRSRPVPPVPEAHPADRRPPQ